MPWCPKCKAEYREGFYVCADCSVPLIDEPPLKETVPNDLARSEKANSNYSYAKESISIGFVKVHETEGVQRIGLQDFLEDNNIAYEIKIVPYWTGTRYAKYHEKQCFYVDSMYENVVNNFKNEFADNIENENLTYDEDPNTLPQVKCTFCGKEIDFDYVTCPFCNHKL